MEWDYYYYYYYYYYYSSWLQWKDANWSGMGTSHNHLDWPRLSHREQFKEEDEEADRGNDGKTTSKSGLALNVIPRKADNRDEWRKLVVKSTVVPQRSARLWDRYDKKIVNGSGLDPLNRLVQANLFHHVLTTDIADITSVVIAGGVKMSC